MRSQSSALVSVVLLALVAILSSSSAMAQSAHYYHRGTFMMGGGVNSPVGEANPYLNSSGTFFFGGGRNVSQRLGIQVEYTHNWLAIAPEVIDHALADGDSITGTHASLWSVSLNGVFRFGPENDFVPWVTGGAGYYKRNLQFTQTALVYYPPIWDPWWGWVDGGWGPGEAIVGEHAGDGWGYNVGFGVDLAIEGGASLFIEARYHQAFLPGVDLQIVPVSAGIRW